MAKTATATSTRTATRGANAKTKKEGKPSRPPSAYNLFVKEHFAKWKEANPGKGAKDGLSAVAEMWRDAPENPKRGQAPAEKKAKKEKENTGKKAPAKKAASKKKAAAKADDEESEATSEPASDE